MKVLAIRLDASGDVLMCTPALAALAGSGHRVTLLTSSAGALVGRRIDEVDEVLVFAAPWMKAGPHAGASATLAMTALLAAHRFDLAVIFTSYSQSALPAAMLCHLAGIPRRLAYCRENPYQLLTDWLPETEPHQAPRHEVQRQLDLVAHLGCSVNDTRLRLRITTQDRQAARVLLQSVGIDTGTDNNARWLLLHPGASAASRRYPSAHWSALAALLAEQPGWPLLMAVSADEQALAEEIGRGMSVLARPRLHIVAGALDFGGLAALIETAPLLVANNSAPAHLAAATGTPVVDLYALTNPQHTPWQVAHKLLFHPVPCRDCRKSVCPQGHHDCLRKLAPATVARTVLALLAETQPSAGRAGRSGEGMPAFSRRASH